MASKNSTLFPDELSAEQIRRHREIYQTLRAYAKGEVSLEAVMAIPKEEILATRKWVNEVSVAMLEAELPEFSAYEDEAED